MKYNLFLGSFLVINIFFLTNCSNNNKMNNLENILNNVKNEFVPDKRVGIFNIQFNEENGKISLTGESDNLNAVNNLLSKLKENGVSVDNKIKILPDKNLGSRHYGIINLSVANIRSKPAHPAELATQGLLGTSVNILKKEDDWYLIQTPDKYISWVDDDAIFLVDESGLHDWNKGKKVVITEPYCFAFKKPNKNSDHISDLVLGDILKFSGKRNGFTEIEFPDKRIGFVKDKFVKMFNDWTADSISTGKTITSTAKEFVGIPYLWGGTSAKAFDCSGFTKTVYFMNGVILPRDASQQVNVGDNVDVGNDFENLKAGDLLFFGKKKTEKQKEKVTHVAIYLGDGEFIHASGRVKTNSLIKSKSDYNEYRYKTFIRAKRIIGSYDRGENLVKNNPFYN